MIDRLRRIVLISTFTGLSLLATAACNAANTNTDISASPPIATIPPELPTATYPRVQPTPDQRWRNGASESDLKAVVADEIKTYDTIFHRSLLITNVKILSAGSLIAAEWDNKTQTLYIYRSGITKVGPRVIIHEAVHADIDQHPQALDPSPFIKAANIFQALVGENVSTVQIIIPEGFRFHLYSPIVNNKNILDNVEVISNATTDEAATEAIRIIADKRQGYDYVLGYDTLYIEIFNLF